MTKRHYCCQPLKLVPLPLPLPLPLTVTRHPLLRLMGVVVVSGGVQAAPAQTNTSSSDGCLLRAPVA